MDREQLKTDFVGRMHSPQQMQQLFNYLPDIYFFAKNLDCKFVMGNDHFVHQCGALSEVDIIGKSDFDFFPVERAETYVKDDLHVMQTGESIVDRVELAPDPNNSINWFVTTKVPLYSSEGDIMGLAGTSRDIARAGMALRPYTDMRVVLEFVRANYSGRIEIKALAGLVNISVSQFERRFRTVFQITPLKHIMNVRTRAASVRLTTTNDAITDIAHDCGFYDHSHFTRNFKRAMGCSPREYRKQYMS
jgi:AraC-like DNA-binding protein